jgi:zinc transporter 1/2/3
MEDSNGVVLIDDSLLEPAYEEIGPNTCVGMTGGWAEYTWPPAIALTSAMITFLMEFAAERYVEKNYALPHATSENQLRSGSVDSAVAGYSISRGNSTHQAMHSADQDQTRLPISNTKNESRDVESSGNDDRDSIDSEKEKLADIAFKQQIAAFLILEFGVIFHSVIIGLTLATAGSEFAALYPVIVFHQSFEGLGIGARLSAIPFPRRLRWMPWALCSAYGLTTPIAIAIGLGVRTTYNAGSFTANVVSGVLDSTSAGILIYTGFVELIARDFLFNPDRPNDDRKLAFMVVTLFLGAGIMALLGKWA